MLKETQLIVDQLKNKKIGKDGLINQSDLDLTLALVGSEKIKNQIRDNLIDLNLVEFTKGVKSYNSLQHRLKRYVEKELLSQLIDKGSSTFKANESEIETLREEEEGICTLNKNGQLIRALISMDNISERRLTKTLKENQDKIK